MDLDKKLQQEEVVETKEIDDSLKETTPEEVVEEESEAEKEPEVKVKKRRKKRKAKKVKKAKKKSQKKAKAKSKKVAAFKQAMENIDTDSMLKQWRTVHEISGTIIESLERFTVLNKK